MPRLKITNTEIDNRLFKATLIHNMEQYGIKVSDIAKYMLKTERTVHNKLNKPESCTLEDIRLFKRILKLTDEQILDLVGGRR